MSDRSPIMALMGALDAAAEPMERDELLQAMLSAGVTEKSARKCIRNAFQFGRIERVIEGGHTRYRRKAGLAWQPRAGAAKSPVAAEAESPVRTRKGRRAARKPAHARKSIAHNKPKPPVSPFRGGTRFAVFSDGAVDITSGDRALTLAAEEAVELITFLRRVGAIREAT